MTTPALSKAKGRMVFQSLKLTDPNGIQPQINANEHKSQGAKVGIRDFTIP